MKLLALLMPVALLCACGGDGSGSGSGSGGGGGGSTTPPGPTTQFFGADNGSNNHQLWKTDGTESGTVMVKVINESTNANIQIIGPLGSNTAFTAKDGIHGKELWITDGTEAGTTMVKDIYPGTASSIGSSATIVDGIVYFIANDAIHGRELWKSDGTEAGTLLVKDINPGSASGTSSSIVAVGSTLYFSANNGVNGLELWKSDGSEAGTMMVTDIIVGSPSSYPQELTAFNGDIYFRAGYATSTASYGVELWKSDGTAAGTVMVADIHSGSSSSSPRDPVEMGGYLYFSATGSNALGEELWRSDGTTAGTALVKNINPVVSSNPNNSGSKIAFLTALGDKLYFLANLGTGLNKQVWVSDGTDAGTIMLHDAAPTGNVNQMFASSNTIYFTGADAINGASLLWKTDGTVAGTVLLNNTVYDSYEISHSDYFSAPTAPIREVLPGTLLFVGWASGAGSELWKTDGTEAGTALVMDINPGAGGSF